MKQGMQSGHQMIPKVAIVTALRVDQVKGLIGRTVSHHLAGLLKGRSVNASVKGNVKFRVIINLEYEGQVENIAAQHEFFMVPVPKPEPKPRRTVPFPKKTLSPHPITPEGIMTGIDPS